VWAIGTYKKAEEKCYTNLLCVGCHVSFLLQRFF
jgi:hypothetical protein